MSNIETPENLQDLPLAIVRNMITLATSGFGVVVALAWNEAIKKFVNQFISPYFGESGGVISLIIYALIMTVLAVVVTMQLSQFEKRLVDLNEIFKSGVKKNSNIKTQKNKNNE
ncbi:MAG: hypothetical protein GW941_00510 [Candidatus Pacebacteria bacterium]|nr:hypothetical protein [Candidatus Paceibacterota bacterium]